MGTPYKVPAAISGTTALAMIKNMRRYLFPFTLILSFIASCTALCGAETNGSVLSADSDFENGNAIIREIDAARGRIVIEPENIRETTHNIWWHVRITGITPGQTIELALENISRTDDINPVYSYDGVTWHRMDSRRPPYIQTFEQSTVWIAPNIPYTHSDSLTLAESLSGKDVVETSDLCTSEGGRAVKLLRFTDTQAPDDKKKVIWILARQHAFESHSSRVADGLARWLCEAEAAPLLRQAIVFIVPIMDVDSVYEGATGKDQQPVDFNRCWDGSPPHWAAVRASIAKLDELMLNDKHELAAFIDLHSPYYYQASHTYLPETLLQRASMHEFFTLFSGALKEIKAPNQFSPHARFASFTNETNRSRDYVRTNLLENSPNALITTIEISHWTDSPRDRRGDNYITAEGLRYYGRGIGIALMRWLGVDAYESAPSILSISPDTSVSIGSAFSLTVDVAGTAPFSYAWFRNGVPIANATDSTYSVTSASIADIGSYEVRVTNQAGEVTSSPISVDVSFNEDQLIEYAFGGSPNNDGSLLHLPLVYGNTTSKRLEISFAPIQEDLLYTVQYSTDLITWTDIESFSGNASLDSNITIPSPLSIDNTLRQFLRLKISIP